MARSIKNDITIQKIITEHDEFNGTDTHLIKHTNFLVRINNNEHWSHSTVWDIKKLTSFRDHLTELIEKTSTGEKLGISTEKGEEIDKHHKEDPLCQDCSYKLTNTCDTCLFDLQSPLERKLYLKLRGSNIRFHTQYGIGWDGEYLETSGKTYNNPNNNFKNVLTISDFYIKKGREKQLCVYTDGHTYHERTEEQAQRDKRIDRKLQEFGYTVFRYTGKDINENLDKVIKEIETWYNA